MKIKIDKIKDKTGIGFGTSGIRGLASELTDEVVYQYCQAFLGYCAKSFIFEQVAIAGDLRDSTDHIMSVVAKVIEDENLKAINCGKIPTPALALYAQSLKIPAVMVTGSHIPADRNGVKFYLPTGEVLKSDEKNITDSEIEFVENNELTTGLSETNNQAREMYVSRYLNMFDKSMLSGKKIGVYGHSAVGRDVLVEILEGLGASVFKIGYSDKFVPVDTEVVEDDLIIKGREWAKEYGLDCIVSTDGDSDRPLVSDKNGNWIRSDILGIVTGKYLGYKKIVCPVNCNSALEKSSFFDEVIRTKIGSPYVIEELRKHDNACAGYEANGGFLAYDLQTRDAVLPILCSIIAHEDFDKLPKRFTQSSSVKGVENVEIKKEDVVKNFGEIDQVNTLDGDRYILKNGEVVHFRPSKNAPECRCYSEANTRERAVEIVRVGLEMIKSKSPGVL